MKRILLLMTLVSSLTFGQTVRTSVADGDFFNPTTWTPFGIPGDGDSLYIDHDVNMTVGIPYTMGRITVNSGGSLSDGGAGYDIYCNGGSFVNYGNVSCNDIWLDSGLLENHGDFDLDSMWTQGTVNNTGIMTMNDYLADQNETVTNDGTIDIANNFNNQGLFYNNGEMFVGNNFANWNTQTSDATYECDGVLCVSNDWSNFNTDDTVRGSGLIYIGNESSNLGIVQGTLTFHTPGGSFTFNSGTVEGTVTFGTGTCSADLDDNDQALEFVLFPNPATSFIQLSIHDFKYEVYDFSGRLALNGVSESGIIELDGLNEGMYSIRVMNNEGQAAVKTFMKN